MPTNPPTVAAARLDVLRTMISLLRRDPTMAKVTVWEGWPADSEVTSEMLWSGELTGDCEIPVLTGAESRHHRSDVWQIDWYTRVAGVIAGSSAASIAATHDRLAVIAAGVENMAADDPTIGLSPTLSDAIVTRVEQGVSLTSEGPIGYGHIVLTCESRLT